MDGNTYPSSAAPTLSVVVAARNPWPSLRACLDALQLQVGPLGVEVVVAVTGSEVKPPDGDHRYPGFVWVTQSGGSVFSLRAHAIAQTRGKIVAMTEDHAWVAPDWCRRILDAHETHPDVAAIGGVVENAATTAIIDWASFFIASGPYMAPITTGVSTSISLQANVSYKRRVISASSSALGMMQLTFNRDLAAVGQKLLADDRIVVYHDQALSWRRHSAAHFHNGRSIAAFRLPGMSPGIRVLRAMGCLVLPPVMLWRTLRDVGRKRRHVRELITSIPLIVWLLCCHACGEFFGYTAGPGDSPWRVE